MDKLVFLKKKDILLNLAIGRLEKTNDSEQINDIKKAIELLNQYTYENRLEYKGLLGRTIVDSLENLDKELTERFIKFDREIT